MGKTAKESFGKGIFAAKELASKSFGLLTAGLTGFGALTAFTGLMSAAEAFAGQSQLAAYLAEREQDARAKTLAKMHAQIAALRETSELQREITMREQDRSVTDPVRQALEALNEKRMRLADENPLSSLTRITDSISKMTLFSGGGEGILGKFGPFAAWKSELESVNEEYTSLKQSLRQGEEEMKRISARQISDIRAAYSAKLSTMELTARASFAAVSGDTAESDRLREQLEYHRSTAEILKVIADGEMRGFELARLDAQRHEARLRQIDLEQAARAKADADRKASIAFENEAALAQQDLERLKLMGQEASAKAVERELEHKRNLRAIETAEGLTDAQRAERIANENRNYALRTGGTATASAQGVKAPAGLLSFSSLRSALGGETVADKQLREQSRQARLQEETNELLRLLNNKPTDFAARFV